MKDLFYKTLTNSVSRFFQTPRYLILFVSNQCWMKCKHCWFSEEWKCDNLKEESLSFEELDKLSNSLNKMLFLSITGGEAFGRNDIEAIVKLFTGKNKTSRYQIPTSGYLTSQIISKTETMLIQNPGIPFRVDVSLDGNDEIHDRIRNLKGSYKCAVETIKELNKLKKKFPYFDVGVITTISCFNQHIIEEISGIIKDVHSDGEWMVNLVRGDTRDSGAADVDLKNYNKAQDIINARIKDGSYKGHSGHLSAKWLSAKNSLRRKVISDIVENKKEGGACSAGAIAGVIYADGSVYPCEMLGKSFGNLRDFDFDLGKIWNSKTAVEIRNWIQDNHCICTQECFLSTSLLMQPQLWPDLIYERLKL
ncbi:MAG TPA: radical SAM protein [Ignavibacteria bacterium]|nr:radical SAM protein [Ignavibacteria bacterium]